MRVTFPLCLEIHRNHRAYILGCKGLGLPVPLGFLCHPEVLAAQSCVFSRLKTQMSLFDTWLACGIRTEATSFGLMSLEGDTRFGLALLFWEEAG